MANEYLKNTKLKESIYKKFIKNSLERQVNDLEELKIKQNKINFKITSLYNQRLSDRISETDYKNNYNNLVEQRKYTTEKISEIEKQIEDNKIKLNTLKQKKAILKKVWKLEKTDLENFNIREIIQKIEVFKKEITIHFNFQEVEKIKF